MFSVKKSKKTWDRNPINELDFNTINISEYYHTLKYLNVCLDIKRVDNTDTSIDEYDLIIFKKNGYYIDGYCINSVEYSDDNILNDDIGDYDGDYEDDSDENDGDMKLFIILNCEKEYLVYNNLLADIHDIVAHEIEHLTQDGLNKLDNKTEPVSFELRDKVKNLPFKRRYIYYLLKDEIPAIVRGLYCKAKFLKMPLNKIFDDNITQLIKQKIIPNTSKERLFKAWKKYAIKHYPKAIFEE